VPVISVDDGCRECSVQCNPISPILRGGEESERMIDPFGNHPLHEIQFKTKASNNNVDSSRQKNLIKQPRSGPD
jgi:hypothetical protein